MATGRITVFGGSGFIGRNLVPLLLRGSAAVRVAVRHPDRLRMAIGPAQALETTQADVLDDTAVTDAIARTDAVVNLVDILTALTRSAHRRCRRVRFPSDRERHGGHGSLALLVP